MKILLVEKKFLEFCKLQVGITIINSRFNFKKNR